MKTIPRTIERRSGEHTVKAYPGLADEGDSVAIRVFESDAEQLAATRAGVRRLLLLNVAAPNKAVVSRLTTAQKLALSSNPHGSVAALLADCAAAAVDALVAAAGGPVWDEAGFAALLDTVRAELPAATLDVLRKVEKVLASAQRVETALRGARLPAESLADIRAQLAGLIHPGFVTAAGPRLPDIVRYLAAIERRVERLPNDPTRDALRVLEIRDVQQAYDAARARKRVLTEPLAEIRWMIEELRISLFAHPMKTAVPVSETRILRALDAAR